MDTMLIQITNQKAYRLLEDLEDLHIIKVLKKDAHSIEKLSEKFGGKLNLSDKEYNDFQEHLKRSREEWEKHF
jgi:hypothetical protein